MPHLLTKPRELRDEIYKWLTHGPLLSLDLRASERGRKRVSYDEDDENTYCGDDYISYPEFTSPPSTYAFSQTSRQLRAEFLEILKPLKYMIEIVQTAGGRTIPRWISVPAFARLMNWKC